MLDPTRWFVVVPDMFSNGLSSSASHADPHDPTAWPALVTVADNVRAQHRLLTEVFDVQRVVAAYGFSMGAGQAYHWAALFPELVERAVVVCGSARTSVHNQVFLRGLLRILEAAPEHLGGGPVRDRAGRGEARLRGGLRGVGAQPGLLPGGAVVERARLRGPRRLPPEGLGWTTSRARRQPTCTRRRRRGCTGTSARPPEHAGDLPAALAAIEAKVLLVPSETDLYFRVADNEAELEHLRHGALAVIPGVWGHWAGSPEGLAAETAFLTDAVSAWLDA